MQDNFDQPKPLYCPCCSDTGIITASEKQTRERWGKIQIDQPGKFKILVNKGLVKFKDGEILGITAVFACGCREVSTSISDDKKSDKSAVLATFSTYFPGIDNKCMADSTCNPSPGDGRCHCPEGYKHHKAVLSHRENEIKEDPYYKKYMNRLAESGSKRVIGTEFERVGKDIDINKVISEAGNDSQDRSRNYS